MDRTFQDAVEEFIHYNNVVADRRPLFLDVFMRSSMTGLSISFLHILIQILMKLSLSFCPSTEELI